MSESRVGVLALQGDFALHAELLTGLGVAVKKVRTVEDLATVDGLVVPGGESTTLRKLMRRYGLDEAIVSFAASKPVLGTCAGCILLAHDLENAHGVEPLQVIDITVERNAYGRQVDSFEAAVTSSAAELNGHEVSFIRAPRISRVGEGVDVLGTHGDEVVAVRQANVTALTFHPEVTRVDAWHREWVARIG